MPDKATVIGIACGIAVEVPAIVIALTSTGFGHGDYVAARLLFPYSMLLALVEGMIGLLSMLVGLLQFPVYGGLLDRAHAKQGHGVLAALVSLHILAVVVCFSGALDQFVGAHS